MGLIVVDASVIVDLLAADDVQRRKAARERLASGEAIFAPVYIDIEVVAALRGLARRSDVLAADAPALITRWLRMPVRREPLAQIITDRIWQLRANMTAYDAGYVALAEHLTASLLTYDRKYAAVPSTPGTRCRPSSPRTARRTGTAKKSSPASTVHWY